MKLEIFPILPVHLDGAYMLDLERRVACVEVDFQQRRGRLHFDDPGYEPIIRPMFEGECVEFHGEIEGGDGTRVHPAWSQEAFQVIFRDKLPRHTLGARPMPSR